MMDNEVQGSVESQSKLCKVEPGAKDEKEASRETPVGAGFSPPVRPKAENARMGKPARVWDADWDADAGRNANAGADWDTADREPPAP